MPRRNSLVAALLAVAALMLAALPTSAAVHPGSATLVAKEIVITGSFDPPDNIGGATAACPAGEKVIGGGAYFHLPGKGRDVTLRGYIASSAPLESGSGWFASGINWNGTDLHFRVIAYCRPAAAVSGMVVKHSEQAVGSKGSVGSTVICGAGNKILTGGAYWHLIATVPPASNLEGYLRGSSPTDDAKGWYVAGYNDHSSTTYRLHVTAICLPIAELSGQKIKTGDLIFGQAASPKAKALACPSGTRLTAGGVRFRDSGAPVPVGTKVYIRGGATPVSNDAAYWVGAENQESPKTMHVAIVCLPV